MKFNSTFPKIAVTRVSHNSNPLALWRAQPPIPNPLFPASGPSFSQISPFLQSLPLVLPGSA